MYHWVNRLTAAAAMLAAAAAMLTATAAAASADTFRIPESGTPALVAEAPAGWTGQSVRKDEMTMQDASDQAILEMSVISDPAMAAKSLPDIAHQILVAADLSPRWTSTEPDTIAGLQGQAFIEPIARDGQPVGLARVVVAKIDAGHVARLTEITLIKMTTPQEMSELGGILAHLRLNR